MNSRQKGAAGEREWAKYLRDMFGLKDARRGVQFQGSSDSPDCTGAWAGTHTEVKRVERFDPYKWIDQAVNDAGQSLIPYVAHRQNGQQWLITIRAGDLVAFCQRIVTHDQRSNPRSTNTNGDSATTGGDVDTTKASQMLTCSFNN